MIKVYYAYTSLLENTDLNIIREKMATAVISKLDRLRKESDRSLQLLSWYLLSYVLQENGCHQTIDQVVFTPEGRPFFPGSGFDFNITHSGSCAAIAFSADCHVGIDIEEIVPVSFFDFESVFTRDMLEKIANSDEPLITFYRHWTMLESSLKADGAGLPLISGNTPEIQEEYVVVSRKKWYYRHISFNTAISCCIASDKAIKEIVCSEVKLS
ncbi:MAG: 4'-phosphopantetheinyl transferase superfamily protein [Bacteroidales bacterium]|nr:4'-phosphopantetheinyl transferase superfamily protein [Bacteroidales bacterium]MDD3990461.1 4'-phosphopantetheinyl transferase superfamily protein [Bacteroidales bacterium]MDD4639450.1 4'-phosphopantetheinyl transferase superfamily protein [Bacteroidales bacterium]